MTCEGCSPHTWQWTASSAPGPRPAFPGALPPAELKPVTAWGPAWLYEKASAQAGTSRSDRPEAATGLRDFLRKGAFPVTPGTQLNH